MRNGFIENPEPFNIIILIDKEDQQQTNLMPTMQEQIAFKSKNLYQRIPIAYKLALCQHTFYHFIFSSYIFFEFWAKSESLY